MQEIHVVYIVNGTTKEKTFKAKKITAQLAGKYSDEVSIINLLSGNPDGITCFMMRHAETAEIRDIPDDNTSGQI